MARIIDNAKPGYLDYALRIERAIYWTSQNHTADETLAFPKTEREHSDMGRQMMTMMFRDEAIGLA